MNTLVIRSDLAGDPPFRQVLSGVHETALQAYAHQDLPFEQVLSALEVERSLSYAPLFQVFFAFLNLPDTDLALEGLTVDLLEVTQTTSKFDLSVEVHETARELWANIEYNTDLFDADTIQRLLGHWQTLLESIVARPEQRISMLPLLSQTESKLILSDWNQTATSSCEKHCLHQLFTLQASRTPDAIALQTPTGSLTYQEVEWRSNQIAHVLCRLGIDMGAHIGVCMPKVPEAMIVLLGILKAGGVYVPLDPHYPQERLAFMVEDAEIAVFFTQDMVRSVLPLSDLPTFSLTATWFQETAESTDPLEREITPEQPAYMIYTSGSTGRPKGVQVSHQGIQNLVEVQTRNFDLRAEDHILQFSSLSFDASIWEICMSLCVGATLCLGEEDRVLAGPALQETIEQQAITVITLPPSVLESLSPTSVPQLRTIIVAGEACPPGLAARWAQGRRFWNAYGPTEATVCVTMELYTGDVSPFSIGRPLANTQIYILDTFLQPVPVGVPGELFIGGGSLAHGYFKRPELTAERFVPHPFAQQEGARLYKTGDLGRYRADGTIEFLGRVDNQVKIRGHRIETGEIEAVLLRYPPIQECIVVVNDSLGEEKRLIAYVVLHAGNAFSSEEIRAYLHQHLPDYMLPANILPLEQMPLGPNGKIDRKELPDPESVRQQAENALALPSTASERIITAIWQECLHIEKIGCNENFFELGAHSLHVVQIIQKIQEHFQREIALTDLFQYPTVQAFASYLDQMVHPVPLVDSLANTERMEQKAMLQAGKDRLKKKRLKQESREE